MVIKESAPTGCATSNPGEEYLETVVHEWRLDSRCNGTLATAAKSGRTARLRVQLGSLEQG